MTSHFLLKNTNLTVKMILKVLDERQGKYIMISHSIPSISAIYSIFRGYTVIHNAIHHIKYLHWITRRQSDDCNFLCKYNVGDACNV